MATPVEKKTAFCSKNIGKMTIIITNSVWLVNWGETMAWHVCTLCGWKGRHVEPLHATDGGADRPTDRLPTQPNPHPTPTNPNSTRPNPSHPTKRNYGGSVADKVCTQHAYTVVKFVTAGAWSYRQFFLRYVKQRSLPPLTFSVTAVDNATNACVEKTLTAAVCIYRQ